MREAATLAALVLMVLVIAAVIPQFRQVFQGTDLRLVYEISGSS